MNRFTEVSLIAALLIGSSVSAVDQKVTTTKQVLEDRHHRFTATVDVSNGHISLFDRKPPKAALGDMTLTLLRDPTGQEVVALKAAEPDPTAHRYVGQLNGPSLSSGSFIGFELKFRAGSETETIRLHPTS